MYSGLLHAHSGLRWIALILLFTAVIKAAADVRSSRPIKKNKYALFALISVHLQLLIGLGLFFISPKVSFTARMMSDKILRFFTLEHTLLMIIAIMLVTIGYSTAKRQLTVGASNKKILVYYGIALVLILIRIPWPFLGVGGAWF